MRAFIFLLLAGLAGCAATPPQASYGNFAAISSPASEKTMAADAVKRLVKLYPPASTRFNLLHATPDAFGASLIEAMRSKGYALQEYKGEPATPGPGQAPAAGALSLSYTVDQPVEIALYRVTLLINKQPLSRVYETKNGTFAPAGYWVRKE